MRQSLRDYHHANFVLFSRVERERSITERLPRYCWCTPLLGNGRHSKTKCKDDNDTAHSGSPSGDCLARLYPQSGSSRPTRSDQCSILNTQFLSKEALLAAAGPVG